MLGLIGVQATLKTPNIYTDNNGDRFNLQPWAIVLTTSNTKKYPSGKITIPPASQEDFKRFLKDVPEMSQFIGELSDQAAKIWQEAYNAATKAATPVAAAANPSNTKP